MKKKLFKIALNYITKRIQNRSTKLTPEYLKSRGWEPQLNEVMQKVFWSEPNIKDRDRVSIEFQSNYYRVWHSDKMTFISLHSSVEWFEAYHKLISI